MAEAAASISASASASIVALAAATSRSRSTTNGLMSAFVDGAAAASAADVMFSVSLKEASNGGRDMAVCASAGAEETDEINLSTEESKTWSTPPRLKSKDSSAPKSKTGARMSPSRGALLSTPTSTAGVPTPPSTDAFVSKSTPPGVDVGVGGIGVDGRINENGEGGVNKGVIKVDGVVDEEALLAVIRVRDPSSDLEGKSRDVVVCCNGSSGMAADAEPEAEPDAESVEEARPDAARGKSDESVDAS